MKDLKNMIKLNRRETICTMQSLLQSSIRVRFYDNDIYETLSKNFNILYKKICESANCPDDGIHTPRKSDVERWVSSFMQECHISKYEFESDMMKMFGCNTYESKKNALYVSMYTLWS